MNRLPIIAAFLIVGLCCTARAQDTTAHAPVVTVEAPDSLKDAHPNSQTIGETLKATSLITRTPLIVIDGVAVTGELVDKKPNLLDTKVTDIESITILKYPSAELAYYGPSGTNGVILIVTKHHKGN
jgi:TonB-dependent SusC/RagA subfamily outer membrane receptor